MAATPSRTHETALPEKEFVTGWGENSAYVRYWAIEILLTEGARANTARGR